MKIYPFQKKILKALESGERMTIFKPRLHGWGSTRRAFDSRRIVMRGGYVHANDGDRHIINPAELVRLYGLDPKDCVLVYHGQDDRYPPEWPRLYPRSDGNYELPGRKKRVE